MSITRRGTPNWRVHPGEIFSFDLNLFDMRSPPIAYLVLAFAPNVWWVLAARIMLGLTFGNVSVVIATQAQLTPRRYLGTAIATIHGFICGVTAGGFASTASGFWISVATTAPRF